MIYEGSGTMKTFTIKMMWDDGYWHTGTESPLNMTLESKSYDKLVERVRIAAPEIIELNTGYTGPIELVFVSERVETLAEAV